MQALKFHCFSPKMNGLTLWNQKNYHGDLFWSNSKSAQSIKPKLTPRVPEWLCWFKQVDPNGPVTLIFNSTGLGIFILGKTHCTIVDGGPGIMAKIFGVFGTKIWYFIKENMTKNGPLVFHTVLCSKHNEKLGNCERKTLRGVVGCGIVKFRSIFVCQMLELARNHMVLLLGKLCDRNLYSTI